MKKQYAWLMAWLINLRHRIFSASPEVVLEEIILLSAFYLFSLAPAVIRGVIVDIDDTLYRVEKYQEAAWYYALDKIDFPRSKHPVHGQFFDEKHESLKRIIRMAFSTGYFKETTRQIRLQLLTWEWLPLDIYEREVREREAGVNEAKIIEKTVHQLEKMFEVYRLEYLNAKVDELGVDHFLIPGTKEAIEAFVAKGLKVTTNTSSNRYIADNLMNKILGKEWVDKHLIREAMVFGDEVPARKPVRISWDMAAKNLGLAPSECIIVDDRPTAIVRALQSNGESSFAFGFVVAGDRPTKTHIHSIYRDMGDTDNFAVVSGLSGILCS